MTGIRQKSFVAAVAISLRVSSPAGSLHQTDHGVRLIPRSLQPVEKRQFPQYFFEGLSMKMDQIRNGTSLQRQKDRYVYIQI